MEKDEIYIVVVMVILSYNFESYGHKLKLSLYF